MSNRTSGELIGYVSVDAGMMMVGDPCYLESWAGHEFGDDKPGEFSYAGACTAAMSDDGVGVLGNGLAAVVTSGYGDGAYPVTIERAPDGTVRSVTVTFEMDEQDELMDECDRCGVAVEIGGTEDGLCGDCLMWSDEQAEENES